MLCNMQFVSWSSAFADYGLCLQQGNGQSRCLLTELRDSERHDTELHMMTVSVEKLRCPWMQAMVNGCNAKRW